MGSKLILLLWLLMGGLLTFFCVNTDKRELLINLGNSYLNGNDVEDNQSLLKDDEVITQLSTAILIREAISNEKNRTFTLSKKSNNSIDNSKKIENIEDKISNILNDNPISFRISSNIIREDSKERLKKIFKLLKGLPKGTTVRVEGYTDATGNASSNKILSQKRANSVKLYFEKKGLTHLEIDAKGYGEGKPLSDNPNDIKNRRVEIHLKGGE